MSSVSQNSPFVLGITGASGAPYAARLLVELLRTGREVHLAISGSGAAVIRQELGIEIDPQSGAAEAPDVEALIAAGLRDGAAPVSTAALQRHRADDFFTPIASGSFVTAGMVICPCSGTTLGAIAHGTGANLIQRAADVHLKEGRKLILVPRETPLSLVHLTNMRRAAEAGAVILPASPGWYHGVKSLDDLIDFVVARILDQLEVRHTLMRRWGS